MATGIERNPHETLETLFKYKESVLENIHRQYQVELEDADKDSERLLKYGFIFVGMIEALTSILSFPRWSEGVLFFLASLMFLTLAAAYVFYESIRIEKDRLRSTFDNEREPITQQISLLRGFLEQEK